MLAVLAACHDQEAAIPPREAGANADLAAHSEEFERGVVTVTDGVHVAIGYGLANAILIEGKDGVIIVDTMESAEAARPVKAAFDKISSKPVKAIIYTHNHADHVFGAGVMAGDDTPEVYSHASTLYYLDRVVNVIRPIVFKRAMRQFGTLLPEGGVINAGIGPQLINDASTTPALIRPNRTFAGEKTSLEAAGVRIDLIHAPGETPDQILVWLPDKKVLMPGDNYYKSFPNLYAIRGTAYRDVTEWVRSLDKMRDLRPEFLVPSHTRPITGAQKIFGVLTDYRDAIQYVHDQTVRAMNEGLTPDAIVERVKLPPHLAAKPYLQEYYGRVDWSVRAIFAGYLGWFGGNATDLMPLDREGRARRFSALAGGREALLERARAAAEGGDHAWALELSDHLLALDPSGDEALGIRAAALRALGEMQISANGRSYYLTQALETEGALEIVPPDPATAPLDLLRGFPIGSFMRALPVNLDPGKSADTNVIVGFRFPDIGEQYTVHVRRGVAEVRPRFPDSPDIVVTADSMVWKEILAGRRNAAVAFARGAVEVEGGAIDLAAFLLLFRR
jgi:alkyl sulfatase BDS1-like metallo-beta-lactamase superfamily hydrolase